MSASPHSPHPGTLDIYESSGDGSTVDPSAAYYTVNAEPIWNVYETLVAYNGSDTSPSPSNFVPQGATCVPGSGQCLAQFGNDLVYPNASGAPTYYTFEIDGNARFYDPATSTSWAVYPSDVVFSMARTLAFADYPGFGVYNGWINAQDVLPAGTTWDNGLHSPYNNTPNRILSAFLVNDSAYCPTSTVVTTNGCVTWNVSATGLAWPYLLELVADPMGASIQSCGWATFEEGGSGLGAPDFTGTKAANGDGPCTLPGGYTSTMQSIGGVSYGQYVASLNPKSWDSYELLGANYPSPQASLQWNMVGSGPYYNLNPVNPSAGYFLRASPGYVAPQGCAGQLGCLPEPGRYQPTVNVYWSGNDTTAREEMAAGWADTGQFYPTDTGPVQVIVSNGDYRFLTGIPTLSIYFDPFELNFSLTNLAKQDTVGGINVPGTFLSNVGLREFLVNAFPYATDEATIQTIDGIEYGEHYGGMIPIGMGNYYPTNISWPSGNPQPNASTPGNVSWWWSEITTKGSPWYDSTFAACTSSSPCKFPFVGIFEGPTVGLSEDNWIASIEKLTNGTVQPYQYNVHAECFFACSCSEGLPPGDGCAPIYSYGWAPDYPDPTDYLGPMYFPDSTYTYTDAVSEQLTQPAYDDAAACGHTGYNPSILPYTDSWANLTYWADGTGGLDGVGVADDCQGIAYGAMVSWMEYAAHVSDLDLRVLIYNEAEHIANELALYMYWDQALGAVAYAVWIDPSGINTNSMIGGCGDQLWYDWNYVTNFYNVTFDESGLSSGVHWSVDLAGVGSSGSTDTAIVFTDVINGTYSYYVTATPGYGARPANGTIWVIGNDAIVSVEFTALTAPFFPLTFRESGLLSGTNWTMTVEGIGSIRTNATLVVFDVPVGAYDYNASSVAGYSTPTPGFVDLTTGGATISVVYGEVLYAPYPVIFGSTGLPTGTNWSVSVNGYTNSTQAPVDTFYETNGSWSWQVNPVAGFEASPSNGSVDVSGAPADVVIVWTEIPGHYLISFVEGGLPSGTLWTVSIDGRNLTSVLPTLQVVAVNGTYPWTVIGPEEYLATPASGSVTVDGSNPATVGIGFQSTGFGPMYGAVFSVQGAPVTTWTVWIGGASYPETAQSATIWLFPGTYSWGVTVPSTDYATPSAGTLEVSSTGTPTTVITVSTVVSSCCAVGKVSGSYLSPLAELIIGVLAVAMIGAIIAFVRVRRRTPPPPVPPLSGPPPRPSPFAKEGP